MRITSNRLSQRVLVELIEGPYRHVRTTSTRWPLRVDWRWIAPGTRCAWTSRPSARRCKAQLRGTASGTPLRPTARDTGERPSVDTSRPDLPVWCCIVAPSARRCGCDTFRRAAQGGWRIDKGAHRPAGETLAAAILAAAESGGTRCTPCCGSGTIPIEAVLIVTDTAPGLQRRFAFERQIALP